MLVSRREGDPYLRPANSEDPWEGRDERHEPLQGGRCSTGIISVTSLDLARVSLGARASVSSL